MKKHTQMFAVAIVATTVGSSAMAGEYQVTTALTGAKVDASVSLSSSAPGTVAKYDPKLETPSSPSYFRTVPTTLHFKWVADGEDALNPPATINVKQNFTTEIHLSVSASSNRMTSSAGVEASPPSVGTGILSYYYFPTWGGQYDPPTASFTYDLGNRAGLLTDEIQVLVGAKASVFVNTTEPGQSGSGSSSISVKTTGLTFTPVNGRG